MYRKMSSKDLETRLTNTNLIKKKEKKKKKNEQGICMGKRDNPKIQKFKL